MPKITKKETAIGKPRRKSLKKEQPVQIKKTGLSVPIYNLSGEVEKEFPLPKEIFSVEASPRLMAQYVRVYLANQRQGNAAAKTRGEIVGSTKKIYRQKGTGRARHGSKKAPIFVGGGVVGGPLPKDVSLKINKKQIRKALFCSLSMKIKEKSISGLVNNSLSIEPKTKIIAQALKAMESDNKKVLFILPNMKNNLQLALRNLANVSIATVSNLNPYTVINHNRIFFTEDALSEIVSRFYKNNEAK